MIVPRAPRVVCLLLACLGSAAIAGCSDVPKAPPRFKIDPENAAREAMRLYDQNGDGKLDAKELEASPPLGELLLNLKHQEPARGDCLTAADIQKRLEEWNKNTAIMVPAQFMVFLDGKLLLARQSRSSPSPFSARRTAPITARPTRPARLTSIRTCSTIPILSTWDSTASGSRSLLMGRKWFPPSTTRGRLWAANCPAASAIITQT